MRILNCDGRAVQYRARGIEPLERVPPGNCQHSYGHQAKRSSLRLREKPDFEPIEARLLGRQGSRDLQNLALPNLRGLPLELLRVELKRQKEEDQPSHLFRIILQATPSTAKRGWRILQDPYTPIPDA